ncbi:MAG: tripartite tricarboxylate transporter substrate binding protein [Proteobacteria bacterium]|nr:tripartite tricarboxylate transporter substrate binding protein [Pseudomonadota bacterium]MDA0983060.1 tripartite tricarboxylate transporter substrate binding protein [Pseudomonadota bacterium]
MRMLAVVLLCAPLLAVAQPYPSKPVRVIVPLAAAGTGDTLARVVSEEMAKILGQPFVVENRPGSGGIIGTELVAKAAPDGYTLLSASPSHVIHPALRPKVGYDPIKDFEPITVIANTHQLIVGHPSVPASTVKELVAFAKANPGKLNYGSAGTGSAIHLNMEMFKTMTGTFITHIPYRGSTQSRQDLVAGEVQLSVDGLLPTMPLIKAGKLKAFGLTSNRRSSVAPEIPTLAEAGVTGYASDTWYGIVAPGGTPNPVIATLHAAAIKAINTPSVRDRLTKQGAELVGNTPAEFRALLERELRLWSEVVKDSGAKVD